MKVYILMFGELCQGGTIESVHTNHQGALEAAERFVDRHKGWIEDGDDDSWTDQYKSDWLRIEEEEAT